VRPVNREDRFSGYPGFADLKVCAADESVFNAAIAADSFAANLALNRLGIAMAAKRAMMATTIMISTRVNPRFFIVVPSFPRYD
jgi:hypothetical protein